jgi:hypothetical protein
MNRAHFLFARLRQTVERAPEWTPSRPARAEQIWFPN